MFLLILVRTGETDIQAGLGLPDVMDTVPTTNTSGEVQKPTKLRSLFPETWLWDIVTVGWVGVKSGITDKL